jgi:hypothetical protein
VTNILNVDNNPYHLRGARAFFLKYQVLHLQWVVSDGFKLCYTEFIGCTIFAWRFIPHPLLQNCP